jgi:GT2 family glycosyltransferase
MKPSVSIVCVTFNRRDLVLQCLESCFQQDFPTLEVVVLVNASVDGTEEAIKERFPKTKIIKTHKNIGFFPGLNLAIANSTGDYIMTVDDDAYFMASDAISKLVEAFDKEPELGAVTCNLEGPTETPITGGDRYIHLFTTGFTMLPRKVFTDWVGYYPDVFFRSAGETYVCTRLWDIGKRVKRLVNVRMYHALAMQGRSDRDWKFYGLRSQILVTLMRDPWYLVVPRLTSKFGKSFFQYLRWRHFLTWSHAWMSALVCAPGALHYRRPISWNTQKLIWRLSNTTVSDVSDLNDETGQRHDFAHRAV